MKGRLGTFLGCALVGFVLALGLTAGGSDVPVDTRPHIEEVRP